MVVPNNYLVHQLTLNNNIMAWNLIQVDSTQRQIVTLVPHKTEIALKLEWNVNRWTGGGIIEGTIFTTIE